MMWEKFPVLDDGFVCLVDKMGTDESVVQAARVSYGEGTKTVSTDEGLIRYLMRHRHTTPFEMVELKFLVRCPMDCWRQWIRHRTASVNEYSTRYSEAIDSQQKTKPDEWRSQSVSNKQGSGEFITEWPKDWTFYKEGQGTHDEFMIKDEHGYTIYEGNKLTPGEYLTNMESLLHSSSTCRYERRLKMGVAREQARKDLPLSTYTQAYWKIDLHNLFHFLSLRMDSHAQKEIREYATTIGEKIVAPLFPICWKAFEDYRLKGMFLSRLDIEAIKSAIAEFKDSEDLVLPENKREREETIAKLKRLGYYFNDM